MKVEDPNDDDNTGGFDDELKINNYKGITLKKQDLFVDRSDDLNIVDSSKANGPVLFKKRKSLF